MTSGQVPVRQIDVHDTWAARDLPVLDATIGLLEQSYMVTVTDIAAKTALDPSVVAQALDALNPIYVDFRKTTTGGDPRFWYVFKVTPEARRAVGQWPTAEALVSRLAEELSAAARRESEAENQGLLAYAARLVGDTLRDVTLRAASAVLTPAFGSLPVPEMGQQVPPPPARSEVEFESLVPLPELPELLRPQRADGVGQAAPEPVEPEDAPSPRPEPAATSRAEEAAPAQAPAEAAALTETPAEAAALTETPAEAAAPAQVPAEAASPTETPADAPDLTPWPDGVAASEASAAARDLAPPRWPTSFRSSLGTWPAADVDPDTADIDLNLAQARKDAV